MHAPTLEPLCRRSTDAGRAQRGAYAVEFGLVFLSFFLVLYAILTFGMIFAAQQSLNYAAEQAARSMLTWQVDADTRLNEATGIADAQTAWIANMASNALQVTACYNGKSSPSGPGTACSTGQASMNLRYDYRDHPLIPTLTSWLLPQHLTAQATVDLGIAMQDSATEGS